MSNSHVMLRNLRINDAPREFVCLIQLEPCSQLRSGYRSLIEAPPLLLFFAFLPVDLLPMRLMYRERNDSVTQLGSGYLNFTMQ